MPDPNPSDEILRQALDAAPDGIVVVDAEGRIVLVNPMAERLFEYPGAELVGMPVDELLPERVRGVHAGHRAAYAAHPRTRSMGSGLQLSGRRRSGDEFPLEISLSPLEVGGTRFVVAIVRDVTERRAADEELARVREALALVDDRERIARDLHDTVIQRLFAVGLSLQGALSRIQHRPVLERVQTAIDEIDVTIRDIRSAIFALHTRRPMGASLRDDVLATCREAARALGFDPVVVFDGPIDTLATDEIREHLLATLREALSNVTRHARASSVAVEVTVEDDVVVLRVEDDGVGIGRDGAGTGNGLGNMSERALGFGGRCEVRRASETGGTLVEWTIPAGAAT